MLESRDDAPHALEAQCVDEPDATGAVWKTVATVVVAEGHAHYLVENHLAAEDVTRHVSVGRPRLVRDLLKGEGKNWLGDSALLTSAHEIDATMVPVLSELLRSPG